MNVKSQNNKEHFIFGACLVLVDFVCVKYKRLRDVVVVPTIFFLVHWQTRYCTRFNTMLLTPRILIHRAIGKCVYPEASNAIKSIHTFTNVYRKRSTWKYIICLTNLRYVLLQCLSSYLHSEQQIYIYAHQIVSKFTVRICFHTFAWATKYIKSAENKTRNALPPPLVWWSRKV